MDATVVVRNRASIPVPADSLGAWRAVCQALGHRLFWDEVGGVLHVDSHLDGWTVILDPAHGGVDRGWRGPGGHCEADFVLDVAVRAAPRFSRLGAAVVLTRDGDHTVPLADRVGRAHAAGSCLFISLHTSPAGGQHRVEVVYHLAGWPWAARLAAHLGRWLSRQTQLPSGIRCCLLPGGEHGYAGVLWRAGGGPSLVRRGPRRLAVLAYLGGQSDILGENRLADPAFREDCAQGLLLGVLDFLMEYPLELERGSRMRLLEPVGYWAPLPIVPSRAASAPAGDPGAASDAAPVAADAAPLASDLAPVAADAAPAPAPQGADPASSASAAAGPAVVPADGALRARTAVSTAAPRVVGGSVVVPGAPPGYMFPARVSGSVRVPVSWCGRPGGPLGVAGASARAPSGQVAVREPFG
jgi:N-acetylmuramoyl-L-alanine amidase